MKNDSDPRNESFRPYDYEDITLGEVISTKNGWAERKKFALTKVYTNMSELIQEAKNRAIGTSLAVFKPSVVIDFIWKPCAREWDEKKVKAIYARAAKVIYLTPRKKKKSKNFSK